MKYVLSFYIFVSASSKQTLTIILSSFLLVAG